jgi:hypothetical protein
MSTTKVQSDMVDIDGATTATIATGDKVNFLDITDSLVKEDTVQGILDLVPAGGGAWNIIGTSDASASASLTITGLTIGTYDTFFIIGTGLVPATDDIEAWVRLGDSGGIDSGSTDYRWDTERFQAGATTSYSTGEAQIRMTGSASQQVGSAGGEGFNFQATLHTDATTMHPQIGGSCFYRNNEAPVSQTHFTGARVSTITVDRIQFLFESGNITTGRLTVWGIAHA